MTSWYSVIEVSQLFRAAKPCSHKGGGAYHIKNHALSCLIACPMTFEQYVQAVRKAEQVRPMTSGQLTLRVECVRKPASAPVSLIKALYYAVRHSVLRLRESVTILIVCVIITMQRHTVETPCRLAFVLNWRLSSISPHFSSPYLCF